MEMRADKHPPILAEVASGPARAKPPGQQRGPRPRHERALRGAGADSGPGAAPNPEYARSGPRRHHPADRRLRVALRARSAPMSDEQPPAMGGASGAVYFLISGPRNAWWQAPQVVLPSSVAAALVASAVPVRAVAASWADFDSNDFA